MSSTCKHLLCWTVSDGKIGIDNQCIGLAEALEFEPIVKHASLRSPWRLMFPIVPHLHPHAFRPGDALQPPWPDVLITGGRSGAAASLYVKKASKGCTFTVQIQNPHIAPKKFDVLLVGDHDGVTGHNVLSLPGAINRVSLANLQKGRAQFSQFRAMPGPRVAVVLGGTNRCYRFGPDEATKLGRDLGLLAASGASLMITPSRRTGAENIAILRTALDQPNVWFWDGMGENPYFAMLDAADHILVTTDSISMVSETASTGKPVQILPLPGGDAKFGAFHSLMAAKGITRPFSGALESWNYDRLDDTDRAAALVKSRMADRLKT